MLAREQLEQREAEAQRALQKEKEIEKVKAEAARLVEERIEQLIQRENDKKDRLAKQ